MGLWLTNKTQQECVQVEIKQWIIHKMLGLLKYHLKQYFLVLSLHLTIATGFSLTWPLSGE
jgi:hypothetical protein